MKPKLYSYLAFVLFAAIFIVACKKGDTGPAGPAGPAGAAGAQGPKGDSATANITYSAWLDVPFAVDTLHDLPDPTAIDTIGWSAIVTAPKLTNTILSQGEVKVYFNFGTSTTPDIIELPFTDIFSSGINITTEFVVGKIGLFSANGNPSTYTDTDGKHNQYRYILIPGTTPASSTPGLQWSNYSSVQKAFNLPN